MHATIPFQAGQVVLAIDATAAAPALSIGGDLVNSSGTGLYGDYNNLNMSIAGTLRAALSATGLSVTGTVVASGAVGGASLRVANSAAASTPGTVVKKIEVFNAAGTSLGFIAVYDAIT